MKCVIMKKKEILMNAWRTLDYELFLEIFYKNANWIMNYFQKYFIKILMDTLRIMINNKFNEKFYGKKIYIF